MLEIVCFLYVLFRIAVPRLWVRSLLDACRGLLGCLSGPFWRRLGGLSGPLGGLLVPPGGLPGVSEGIWGAPREPLGEPWGHLRAKRSKGLGRSPLLAPSWRARALKF